VLGGAKVTVLNRNADRRIEINDTKSCAIKLLIMERYHNIAAIEGLSATFQANYIACLKCGELISAVIELTEAD
jgi:hypothetical protein